MEYIRSGSEERGVTDGACVFCVIPDREPERVLATGATAYNILQNNGSAAHQVVMHVHFHIIPKLGNDGLGVGWSAKSLSESTARDLQEKIRAALASLES